MTDPANCPKYLPAGNPARLSRDLHVINQAALGNSQGQIAEQTGISRQRVNQILSDDEAKARLDDIIKLHISESTTIQTQLISMAKGKQTDDQGNQIKHPETEKPVFLSPTDQIKAIAEHNKIIGIAGSHTQNVYIGKLYQQNNTIEMAPDMLDILNNLIPQGDTIDVPGGD